MTRPRIGLYDIIWSLSADDDTGRHLGLGLCNATDAIGALRLIELKARCLREQIEDEWAGGHIEVSQTGEEREA